MNLQVADVSLAFQFTFVSAFLFQLWSWSLWKHIFKRGPIIKKKIPLHWFWTLRVHSVFRPTQPPCYGKNQSALFVIFKFRGCILRLRHSSTMKAVLISISQELKDTTDWSFYLLYLWNLLAFSGSLRWWWRCHTQIRI